MAKDGGGIFMKESTLNTTGPIYFYKNAIYQGSGGGIYAESSSLHLCGDVRFGKNSAQFHGGGMYAKYMHLHLCEESSTLFEGNSANMAGGGVYIHRGLVIVDGYIMLKDNSKFGRWRNVCTLLLSAFHKQCSSQE